MELVYQVSAQMYTPQRAAEEFAKKWFQEPRVVEWFDNNEFGLVNGVSRYKIEYVPEVRLFSAALYQIWRV